MATESPGSNIGGDLSRKALLGFIRLQVVLALLLFLPAWSLRFWEAWIYWIVFSVSVLFITLYFLKHDPRLVERRLRVGPGAEPEASQKIIQALTGLLFCALLIVPGLDHRFHWSALPIPIVLSADVVVVLGLLIVFFVFKENSHTGSVVKVEPGQQVVETGPYRLVRHPMYAGGVLAFLATPLALGSLWALLVAVPLCGAIVARLLDEERFLSAHLPGYDGYCRKVRYRLMPMVW
jgi:protein-S-isoprenylcysteine O-methyltransferase Ste14